MGTASVGLGGAGGGGAVEVPGGPGTSEDMRCVPVNRHVGGNEKSTDICKDMQTCQPTRARAHTHTQTHTHTHTHTNLPWFCPTMCGRFLTTEGSVNM